MTVDSWQLLAGLLAAHFAGDFWLQPDWMYRHKPRPGVLVLHGLVHAMLVVAVLGFQPGTWIAPAIVFATHLPIDWAKLRFGEGSARWFVADQLAHLAVIAALGYALPKHAGVLPAWSAGVYAVLAVAAGWIATVSCGRYAIALAVVDFEEARPPNAGLEQAGRIIGQLERALVFLLVMIGQPGGIGFLVAAKSVFRFGDLKAADERKESEYVIIGTLMSFGYAVLVSSLTAELLAALRRPA